MNWNCFVHGHNYEIVEKHEYKNNKGDIIGEVIVSRCKRCGRITCKTIITVREYGRN